MVNVYIDDGVHTNEIILITLECIDCGIAYLYRTTKHLIWTVHEIHPTNSKQISGCVFEIFPSFYQ